METPCTAMIARRFARRVTAIYDDALAVHRLTIGQFGILAHLRRSVPGGVGALAVRLSSDASTMHRQPAAGSPDANSTSVRFFRSVRTGESNRCVENGTRPARRAARASSRTESTEFPPVGIHTLTATTRLASVPEKSSAIG